MCTGAEIMFAGQIAGALGGASSAFDVAGQYEDRANQILESSKEQMRQTSKQQSRRQSLQRAAYAKSGVKLTGTAKVFTQQQIEQDEAELMKQKYNAQLSVSDELKKSQEAKMQGITGLISGGISAGKTAQDPNFGNSFNLGK